jgi:hypothetical protein
MSALGGIFYYGDPLANEEIQARLDAQEDFRLIVFEDGVRPFSAAKTAA